MFLVESIQHDNFTELITYARDENRKKIVESITDFKPYFYVLESEEVPENSMITGIDYGFISIDGEKVKKIFVNKSKNVKAVREMFSKHLEADIKFENRYLIDVLGPTKPYDLNKLYIDIETNSNDTFPDLQHPNQEITAITLNDSFTDITSTILLSNANWSVENKEKLLQMKSLFICETEEELLYKFIDLYNKIDCDIITGWNTNSFDLVYIVRRMEKLGIVSKLLSPLGQVYIDEIYGEVKIKGKVNLDAMLAYMHFRRISNQGKAESYSLESVAQDVLKKGKIEHEESYANLWLQNPVKFVEYNIRDVMLVKEIDEKLKIIDFFNQLRCRSCSQLVNVFHTSIMIDGMLLNKLHNKIVLPSCNRGNEDSKFTGAFVLEPIPGLYENCFCFDIMGMYPGIIETFNVSYESFDPNGEIRLSEGVGFSKIPGIVPQIIKELKAERIKEKKLMNAAITKEQREFHQYRQYSIKVFMNAFFGYLGFPKSRLYKKPVANAITTMGQNIILHSKKTLENIGYKVIYIDTDSIFTPAKTNGTFRLIKEGTDMVKLLNDSYDEFANGFGCMECLIKMEFEKIFKKILFVKKSGTELGAKKRYAYTLLWSNGEKIENEVKFKGFQFKRSDSPKISRIVQEKVMQMILLENKSRDEIVSYIKKVAAAIRNKQVDDTMIGTPVEIKKAMDEYGLQTTNEAGNIRKGGTPPIVFGARYSNKYLGTRFTKNMKPMFVYIKNVPPKYPKTHVITYVNKIPEGFNVNYDLLVELIFKKKLETIFESIGFGEFPDLNEQSNNLDSYF